jgi:hypothetical protein
VYGEVPPAGVVVADPLLKPKPVAEVADAEALKAAGWVTTTETVVVLLALSVMVTV